MMNREEKRQTWCPALKRCIIINMVRKIIKIDAEKCNGCGLCAQACHEAAISMIDGKARLLRENFCDGLGNCLPVCPTGAISFEEREAAELRQWPVQIKLVPVNAPCFKNAHLLISADCAAYACGVFHDKFMKNKITLIGCPKLDNTDYTDKLCEIITGNDIKSLTVVRMEVPCCAGIEQALISALKNSGKFLPWQVFTLSTEGEVVES